MLKHAALILLLLQPQSAAVAADPDVPTKIIRFQKVDERLYRGGQPSKGEIKTLARLGIKTIINLRREDAAEKAEAEKEGLRYFTVSLPELHRASEEQVDRVMTLINAPENWPVYIHCNHGKDRTGTMVACYRISHDGWTSEAALEEATRMGLSRFEFGMRAFILAWKTPGKDVPGATKLTKAQRPA